MVFSPRLRFAARYASRHLLISVLIALASAGMVFGLWYAAPYQQLLDVGHIYLLVLAVDVVCGPLLTLVLASPKKSRRERWLDFSLIGLIQLAALAYGMHSVWVARPVALVFEADRLVVVTANEVNTDALPKAPPGLRQLPWTGVLQAGTRKATSNEEFMRNVELGLAGISTAVQPDWWLPWGNWGRITISPLIPRPQPPIGWLARIDLHGLLASFAPRGALRTAAPASFPVDRPGLGCHGVWPVVSGALSADAGCRSHLSAGAGGGRGVRPLADPGSGQPQKVAA